MLTWGIIQCTTLTPTTKLNTQDEPGPASKFNIRSIPTMIVFKGGQVAATKIGALPKSKLYEWVESVL